MNELQIVLISSEIVGAFILAVVYIKSRLPKETIEQQGKLIATLQARQDEMISENRSLRDLHIENQKAIADLQGQIKVYKELPLVDIARSLKALENLPKEFDRISKKNTSTLLKAVHSVKNQHVNNQEVDNQTIKGRKQNGSK
jgi:hypothetical protein